MHDAKKALFYAIPLRRALEVSLAIREPERALLMKDAELEALRDTLAAAPKAAEGASSASSWRSPATAA